MELFDVYPCYPIEPVRGEDVYVFDKQGTRYLDFYGGHAVISIGHSHQHYVRLVGEQLQRLGFYSNSILNPLQAKLAAKLGRLSGLDGHRLFLCNSGAEAIENALKLASFHTGRAKVLAFRKAFHGRTSAAVAITDNPAIQAPVNKGMPTGFLDLGDTAALAQALEGQDVCAVIVEGIQGVGGVHVAEARFLQEAQQLCRRHGAMLIMDEVQSGYGRSGKFFAFQHAGISPDLVTVAKGMGNGFPIGGVLIGPDFQASHGLLGTTFGGNHLACAAAIAVLDVIEKEGLMENAAAVGSFLLHNLRNIEGIKEVRGLGLMTGIELHGPAAGLRKALLMENHIFTGSSSEKNTIRLLPPLTLTQAHAETFLEAFQQQLQATALA